MAALYSATDGPKATFLLGQHSAAEPYPQPSAEVGVGDEGRGRGRGREGTLLHRGRQVGTKHSHPSHGCWESRSGKHPCHELLHSCVSSSGLITRLHKAQVVPECRLLVPRAVANTMTPQGPSSPSNDSGQSGRAMLTADST